MNDLHSKVGIVTGASSGIGKAVAEMMLESGMKVVVNARNFSKLSELKSKYDNCEVAAGDISSKTLPDELIRTALDKFKRLDVIFNNAGVMHAGPIESLDIDLMCDMVRVNLEAAVRMAYTALKYFRQQDQGHLINVSSILGTKVRPNTGVYAATKYGIEALSEALRMEVAKSNVKVSLIEPGVTDTNLQTHFENHPMNVLGITKPLLPGDISNCVKFILEQPEHVRIPVMMILPGEQSM